MIEGTRFFFSVFLDPIQSSGRHIFLLAAWLLTWINIYAPALRPDV